MSRLVVLIAILVGLFAAFAVYLTFIAHEFVQAGQSGKALGITGTLLFVSTQRSFLMTAIVAFLLAFYKVTHGTR